MRIHRGIRGAAGRRAIGAAILGALLLILGSGLLGHMSHASDAGCFESSNIPDPSNLKCIKASAQASRILVGGQVLP